MQGHACFATLFSNKCHLPKQPGKKVCALLSAFGFRVLCSLRLGAVRGTFNSQFFLTSRALCPDFDVQIFSQRRALELPYCHFLLAACRWIQFVLLGTLWLGTCADWCQVWSWILKVVFSRFPVPGFILTSRHTARAFAASLVMAINAN